MKRPLPVSLLVLAGLLVALCLPALAAADSPQQSTSSQVSLEMTEFMFAPMSFTATQGQPMQITAHNGGKFPHNVSFQLGSQTMQVFSANIAAGQTQTASFTFPTAGQWRMFCPVDGHAQHGMVGTVDVTAASASALPATGGGGMARLALYEGLALASALAAGAFLLQRRMRSRQA